MTRSMVNLEPKMAVASAYVVQRSDISCIFSDLIGTLLYHFGRDFMLHALYSSCTYYHGLVFIRLGYLALLDGM